MVRLFNAGVLAGTMLIFAGVWIVAGIGAALLAAGAVMWITTHTAFFLGLRMRALDRAAKDA
jgi:hypothetical protein